MDQYESLIKAYNIFYMKTDKKAFKYVQQFHRTKNKK